MYTEELTKEEELQAEIGLLQNEIRALQKEIEKFKLITTKKCDNCNSFCDAVDACKAMIAWDEAEKKDSDEDDHLTKCLELCKKAFNLARLVIYEEEEDENINKCHQM